MTDKEKDEWCRKRNGFGAVIIPPSLYRLEEKQGFDMRWYIMSRQIEKEQTP